MKGNCETEKGNGALSCAIRGALFILFVLSSSLMADEQRVSPAPPSTDSDIARCRQMESEITQKMKTYHIPGAVLVVVKDANILYCAGYGHANLESERAVDPETTVFRAGSISKPFTATAVMQLVERGALDLDRDVNDYLLRFKIQENYPQPVTAANLLTHTAGFAESIHGQHILDKSRFQPLGEYLARRMPSRIRPPGEIFSYNDHGYSLAGFLVQEITQTPFESYMEKNVLQPLGMAHSTFRQPLNLDLQGNLATGYRFRKGKLEPYSLDDCQVIPAASLLTTASDMARFMIAQLEGGRFNEARILKEETIREMQQRHFAHHPKLRGRAFGFSEIFVNGERAIFHDGAMPGFNARLCLLPQRRLGLFLAWNSDDMRWKSDLTISFFNLFCPQQEKPAAIPPSSARFSPIKELEGCYEEVAGFSKSSLRLGSMMENYIEVASTKSGALKAMGSEFFEVEPLFFQDADGFPIAFRLEEKPHKEYLFVGTAAYEELPWYETPNALLAQAVFFILVSMPMGLIWPLGMLLGIKRMKASWRRHFPEGRFLAGLISFLILFFLVGYALLFMQFEHYWQIMRNEFPWSWMTKLLALPLLSSILTIGLPVYAVGAWLKKRGTLVGRFVYSFITISALLYVWILNNWNLLGFKY